MGNFEERFGDNLDTVRSSGLSSFGYKVTGYKTELASFIATNINAAARYLKLYNTSSDTIDPVTWTPVLSLAVPPTGSISYYPLNKISFSDGLTIVATSTGADATGGSPTAGNVQFFAQFNRAL